MNINNSSDNNQEYILNGDWIDIKQSKIISLKETLVVQYHDEPIRLDVTISADLNEIPTEYHEIFLNVISSKYLGKVNFGNNPFSECKPVKKRKWYQLWKNKYFN